MQPSRDDNQFSPVMDVQRPVRPQSQAPSPQQFQPQGSAVGQQPQQPNTVVSSRPATMEYTRPRPGELSAPSFSPEKQTEQYVAPKTKKSKKGPVIALFIVLLLALIGGGGGYYYFAVYSDSKVTPTVVEKPQPVEEANTSKIEATPEGVDKATEQIDQTLNSLNDTEDFKPNDLSNDNLGL